MSTPGLVVFFVKLWISVVNAWRLVDYWVFILHRVFSHTDLRLWRLSRKLRVAAAAVWPGFGNARLLVRFSVDAWGCWFRPCFRNLLVYIWCQSVAAVHIVVALDNNIGRHPCRCVSLLVLVALCGLSKHKYLVFWRERSARLPTLSLDSINDSWLAYLLETRSSADFPLGRISHFWINRQGTFVTC